LGQANQLEAAVVWPKPSANFSQPARPASWLSLIQESTLVQTGSLSVTRFQTDSKPPTMSAPCFSKRFYDDFEDDFDKALRTMKAAVASARSGNDEAVKQVG